MQKRVSMRQMKDNQSGTIASVRANGEMGRRIRDMGLTPGTKIKITRIAKRKTENWS